MAWDEGCVCERLTVPFYNRPDQHANPRLGTAEPNICDVYTEHSRPKTIPSDNKWKCKMIPKYCVPLSSTRDGRQKSPKLTNYGNCSYKTLHNTENKFCFCKTMQFQMFILWKKFIQKYRKCSKCGHYDVVDERNERALLGSSRFFTDASHILPWAETCWTPFSQLMPAFYQIPIYWIIIQRWRSTSQQMSVRIAEAEEHQGGEHTRGWDGAGRGKDWSK